MYGAEGRLGDVREPRACSGSPQGKDSARQSRGSECFETAEDVLRKNSTETGRGKPLGIRRILAMRYQTLCIVKYIVDAKWRLKAVPCNVLSDKGNQLLGMGSGIY